MPRTREIAWSNVYKPDILRGGALNPNMVVAMRYEAQLEALVRRMTENVEAQLHQLYNSELGREQFAMDASFAAQARILSDALKRKYEDLFGDNAKPIAESFAQQSDKASSSAVQGSITELASGLSFPAALLTRTDREILKATVSENVALIQSIAEKYLNGVQQAVMRSITTGGGFGDLIQYLNRERKLTYARSKMIAHDQTRKAFNGLSRGRCVNLGLEAYEWLHSAGSNAPRPLHIRLGHTIQRWDDPPVIQVDSHGVVTRGIPGQLPNCRCRFRPVLPFLT